MTNTEARLKVKGKNFEIIVDLDKAVEFKKTGMGNIKNILEIDEIFSDHKKGLKISEDDLKDAFQTTDIYEIAEKIIKQGEVLITQEYRDKEKEEKLKQIIDILSKNAVDPRTGNPYTGERIKSAIEEGGVNIHNKPAQDQVQDIIKQIIKIIPIKIETKKIEITIPAVHTGKVYGIINQYKEKEEWLGNGDLKVVVNVPAGLIMEFYDKLNSITHGSAITKELKSPDERQKEGI